MRIGHRLPATLLDGRRRFHGPTATKEQSMAKKTICPISRKDFLTHAKPITIKIGEIPLVAEPREFSTLSLGWYLNGKTSIEVNGVPVAVQIGMNLTIVGSKELPKENAPAPAAPTH
jgi:hypothetical protein